jgi:hypothetical protein
MPFMSQRVPSIWLAMQLQILVAPCMEILNLNTCSFQPKGVWKSIFLDLSKTFQEGLSQRGDIEAQNGYTFCMLRVKLSSAM